MADTYPDERILKIRFPDIDKFDPDFAVVQMGNKFEDQNLTCINQDSDWGGPFKLLLAQYARRRNLKEC